MGSRPRNRTKAALAGVAGALVLAGVGAWLASRPPSAPPADSPPPTPVADPQAPPVQPAQSRRLRGWVADDRGLPVAGAEVRLLPGEAHTRTDHAGAFALEAPAGAPVDLEFRAEHHAPLVVREVGEAAVHAVLERTATVTGSVRGPDGAAVADALVEIAGTGLWPSRTVDGGPDGNFRFEGLPGGLYALRASTDSHVSGETATLDVEPGEGAHAQLTVQAGATLAGRVVDAATGKPIDGAEVVVGHLDAMLPPLLIASDAEGRFEATPLPATPHRIAASAPGFVAARAVEATAGGRRAVVRLRRAAVLSGRVVDVHGDPVAGAQLEVVGRSRGKPIVLRHAGLPGGTPTAPGLTARLPTPPIDNLGVVPGPVPPIPLFATAPSAPAQANAGGATPGPKAAAGAEAPPGFFSAADGSFRITGVPGGELRVLARHPTHASGATAQMPVRDGQVREDLELVLQEGFELRGRVVDSDDQPVAGTRISLETDLDPLPRGTVSGVDGRFTLRRLVGACTLVAHAPGHPPQQRRLTLGEGGADVEFELPSRSHVARGRVYDPRGFPVEGALVDLAQGDADGRFRIGLATGPDGTFEALGLPPPPYRLQVTRRGFAPAVRSYVDTRGSELSIKLDTGYPLRMQVVGADGGEGLAGVPLSFARSGDGERTSVRSQAGGRIEVRDLASGEYDVFVDHHPYLPAHTTVAVGPSGTQSKVPLTAGGSASGEVVDSLGAPVYDALVTTAEAPDWDHAARTDHAGHFRLERVPPGPARLTARHPEAGTVVLERPVEVRPGEDAPGAVLRLPERAPELEAAPPAAHGAGAAPGQGVRARVESKGGALTVTAVAPGSAAQREGLRAGDVILEVDGERVFAAGQVRSMWLGDGGTRAVVRIQRGAGTRTLKLTRE